MRIKQKAILMIGAGLEQTIAINIAKKMGIKVIAIDMNEKAPGLKLADVGIVTDTANIDGLVDVGKKYEVDGVMTHAVEIPHIVSMVAKTLGLPHLNPKIALDATVKSKRIAKLKKAGVDVPKFKVAKNYKEAFVKAKRIGFPLVIKPVDNAGARGVKKIGNLEELKEGFKEAVEFSKNKEVVLEQYLEGSQISTESFIYKGNIFTTGFGDRNYDRLQEFLPYFVEDGHSVPSSLPLNIQNKVLEAAENAIKALDINFGVAKGDILISNNKYYVLEMAARTSGGWFAAGTVPIATGVNLLKPLIKITLGDDVGEKDFKPIFDKAACQRYIIPTETGYFKGFRGIRKAKNMPGVKVFQLFNKPKIGQLIHKSKNHSERYGHIITEGKTLKLAINRCENAVKQVKILTRKAS